MKSWFSKLVIGLYLSALSAGIVIHALNFGNASHPVMYYVVWDMFCGWSSNEIRYHVIGEGESGTYYELAPGPWTRFTPFGDLDRVHYDVLGNSHRRMALNALKRTDHEPMRRVIMLEEVWHKKYNLSDRIWGMRFDEPKEPMSYYWQRAAMLEDGTVTEAYPDYGNYLNQKAIAANPRLIQDLHIGKEHYVLNPSYRMGLTD